MLSAIESHPQHAEEPPPGMGSGSLSHDLRLVMVYDKDAPTGLMWVGWKSGLTW
jgi:hypothetical protein